MPYTIATHTPEVADAVGAEVEGYPHPQPGVSRTSVRIEQHRAVATLPEARRAAHAVILRCERASTVEFDTGPYRDATNVSEAGGTIGPLPDATVIEVERVTFADLRRAGVVNGHRVMTNGDVVAALAR